MSRFVTGIITSERFDKAGRIVAGLLQQRSNFIEVFLCHSDPHSFTLLQALPILLKKYETLQIRAYFNCSEKKEKKSTIETKEKQITVK